ncbi:SDR family NAD(P)-dependent oxidoreductase [Rhodococcus koreensis]|uniref:NAD(P)-dependent dehydrogenase, short-chain alcohol dehydrogenase family n=1 Tax=Rhodococcus koreensis TaxID=99653 RepID=A0A1H4IGI9_9NOCA|nr:SDR family oxidoreductase [Rhodococcus koreensis]SEB33219.1 NAD(P)-dependent dehydrogenase, short-chain alcohol dehydrogenase family [Rhodococcus koreensis]
MSQRLTGRVAVVTGATGGLGAAIARRFASEGADLVLTGRRLVQGEALASELRSTGVRVDFIAGDLSDAHAVDALAASVESLHRRIDILVLNAGVISYGPFWSTTPEEFDRMFSVNVRAPWLCARRMHTMLSSGSSVIVMGSISSFTAYPDESVYCMTKSAVIQLVRGMARELADRRIRVNALCPGIVGEAGMSQDAVAASANPVAVAADNDSTVPLGRPAALDEIANGAVFLASEESSYMTGSHLVLDGGILA